MEENCAARCCPAVYRLQQAGIPLLLAYGRYDQPVPYCLIHSKCCVIDERASCWRAASLVQHLRLLHDLYVVVNDSHRPHLSQRVRADAARFPAFSDFRNALPRLCVEPSRRE